MVDIPDPSSVAQREPFKFDAGNARRRPYTDANTHNHADTGTDDDAHVLTNTVPPPDAEGDADSTAHSHSTRLELTNRLGRDT